MSRDKPLPTWNGFMKDFKPVNIGLKIFSKKQIRLYNYCLICLYKVIILKIGINP